MWMACVGLAGSVLTKMCSPSTTPTSNPYPPAAMPGQCWPSRWQTEAAAAGLVTATGSPAARQLAQSPPRVVPSPPHPAGRPPTAPVTGPADTISTEMAQWPQLGPAGHHGLCTTRLCLSYSHTHMYAHTQTPQTGKYTHTNIPQAHAYIHTLIYTHPTLKIMLCKLTHIRTFIYICTISHTLIYTLLQANSHSINTHTHTCTHMSHIHPGTLMIQSQALIHKTQTLT